MEIGDCAKCGFSFEANDLGLMRWEEVEGENIIKRRGFVCEDCNIEIHLKYERLFDV